jgi:hypothetical protein
MRIRLNGWQRFWRLALAVAWLVVVFALTFALWPTDLPATDPFWASDEVQQAAALPHVREGAGQYNKDGTFTIRREDFVEPTAEELHKSKETIDRLLARRLRTDRRALAGRAVAAWILPVAVIYFGRIAVGWIRRSFAGTSN